MKFNSAEARRNRRAVYCRLILSTALLFGMTPVIAAEYFVSSSTSSVNCDTFGAGIKPGDTIKLAAGARGPLIIRNCSGTGEKPITVRNDPTGSGPTVIRRTSASSGGFIFTCRDCVNVVIDGTRKWNSAPQGAYCGAPAGKNGCGIKVTSVAANDSPTAYLKLVGLSTKVTVRGVEIDGRSPELRTTGIGIDQNDHSKKAADFPGFWREDFVYEMNYIHDMYGAGMYIGFNWLEPDVDIPLRNITIRKNLVENTGTDSIKLKSAIEGTNRIHHNVLRRSGLRGDKRFGTGIAVFEGGNDAKIHHNWIESPGWQGIQHYNMNMPESKGPFISEIYNNVIYDAGSMLTTEGNGHAITVASGSSSAATSSIVYNNTIVKVAQVGINFGTRVKGGVVKDNIVAGWGTSALSVGSNTSTNNRTGTVASMKFRDAGSLDFALEVDSPARDSGSSTGFPPDDFMLVLRPQGDKPDQGAFEYSTAAAAPRAPDLTEVK